ncbi:MAG: hypothetical protein M1820_006555 [Bogoriella megaspora]|nr:MAG: hypothetical protein M1820_006555 [Bogoriella megaspora]
MGYESQISFTLDTICPWTYLAKKRLFTAIDQVRSTNPQVEFDVRFFPYQLYPEASKEGEDKYEWYKRAKYDALEEKMKMYTTLMSAYGVKEGIEFKFHGTVANTLDAHKLIQNYQEKRGSGCADKIINALYRQYFEEEKHPSSEETLVTAAAAAGIDEDEARQFIKDENQGLIETRQLIREQVGNGVDSVPYIVFEGKRRDFTLIGAKEVSEYAKVLEQVIKESN